MRKSKHLDVHHVAHYVTILTIGILIFTSVLVFPLSNEARFFIVLLGCIVYGGYGIYHHYRMHDVTIKIVVEYILVSLLALALFELILLGGT